MWVFLGQELLFFGGLFVAYIVFRFLHPDMFMDASHHLSWKMGATNTVILLLSSFTMVMGVRATQLSKRILAIKYLTATFLFAGAFMVVKFFEYAEKVRHGFLPARFFTGESAYETTHIFYGLYFTMTGLHGLHVVVGMGLLIWLIIRTKKGHFHADYYTPVEMVGLYWHLVDLIWIFLFPLYYLIG